jgi:hypothetical protein
MRSLFDFLSIFDWVTPSVGIVENIINDPTFFGTNSWTFFVPYDASLKNGWNAAHIKKLLEENGIKTWGKQISGGEFFFSVSREQAQWAEYLLLRNNIPLHERSLGAPQPNQKRSSNSRKKRPKQTASVMEAIDDFLDGLLK